MSRGKRNQHNTRRRRMNQKKGRGPQTSKPGQWDLLQDTFTALVDYAMLPTSIAEVIRTPAAVEKVEDKQLLVQRTKSLCNDCTILTKSLMSIHGDHAGRKGDPKNPDDQIHAVDVYQRYMDWAGQYEALVYPVYMAINEQIGQAVGVDVMALKPTDLPQFREKEPEHDERAESGIDGTTGTGGDASDGGGNAAGIGAATGGDENESPAGGAPNV